MKPLDKICNIKVTNSTVFDLKKVLWLFEVAMNLQDKNGYKVWESIDIPALERDIEDGLQYKIEEGNELLCIFSIQYNDLYIWRERDKNDAIYLHRIVVNPNFKGQRLFEKVLNWTIQFAKCNNKHFVRMDTWAENHQLIAYYKSFGFQFLENYKTEDIPELPKQNRNLKVALLELKLDE